MPARATQPAGAAAGQALVQVVGAGEIDLETLEICLSGIRDGVEKHLDPRLTGDAWTTTYVWFHPENPRIEGPAVLFDLLPAVTWHLRPHAPYVLRMRDAKGPKREERLTWIAIRLPSQAPEGYVPPKGPTARPAARPAAADPPPPEAAPNADAAAAMSAEMERAVAEREAAERAAAAAAEQRRQDEERRRRVEDERLKREDEKTARAEYALAEVSSERKGISKAMLGGLAVAVLLAIAGGAYMMKDDLFTPSVPPPVTAPVVPTTLDGARAFLARNPGADESFGMAEKFKAAQQLDGEFLLLREAARKGSAPAALALGEMYDPATYTPETSPLPAPNPAQAAAWYRQAAEAGIAQAQYRLGMLLMSGKTDEPNGPEVGISWLRKAADQGLAEAKEALPK